MSAWALTRSALARQWGELDPMPARAELDALLELAASRAERSLEVLRGAAWPWVERWAWDGPCRREGLAWWSLVGRPYDRELDR